MISIGTWFPRNSQPPQQGQQRPGISSQDMEDFNVGDNVFGRVVIRKISNGFLVLIAAPNETQYLSGGQRVVYCADLEDVSRALAKHNALCVMTPIERMAGAKTAAPQHRIPDFPPTR